MNPKNIDRVGKGILVAIAAATVAGAKKYGPKIIKGSVKILRKLITKR